MATTPENPLHSPLHPHAHEDTPSHSSHSAAGEDAAALDPEERRKATEEEKINALVTHEVIRRDGVKELERPPAALAWSGLAAGLSLGLSMVADGILHAHLPDAPWRPLVSKLGYSVGFLAVIIGSQQLYTENTLKPIVPLMARRTREMLAKVLTLWGVVLAANLVGALLFATVAAYTNIFSPEVKHAFDTIARQTLEGSTMTMFARAVFAGWVIALMVWMLPAAGSSKFLVIVVATWLIGAGQLPHIITGSVEVLYLAMIGGTSLGTYFGHFMLPTLLGNTIGGVALVAALNHAQVVAGHAKDKKMKNQKPDALTPPTVVVRA